MISYQRPLNHMQRVKKIYSKRELFHLDFNKIKPNDVRVHGNIKQCSRS
jgi:hypothetical protein